MNRKISSGKKMLLKSKRAETTNYEVQPYKEHWKLITVTIVLLLLIIGFILAPSNIRKNLFGKAITTGAQPVLLLSPQDEENITILPAQITFEISNTENTEEYANATLTISNGQTILEKRYENILTGTIVTEYFEPAKPPYDDPSLYAYWNFDEGPLDASPNNRNATPMDVIHRPRGGVKGGAYEFDGDYDLLKAGTHTFREKNYTISAWFKTNDTIMQTIIGRGSANFGFYNPEIRTNGTHVQVTESGWSGAGVIGKTMIPVTKNDWHNVIVTRNESIVNVFIDGALALTDDNQPEPPNINTTTGEVGRGAVYIGAGPDRARLFYQGLIDEVAIWNRTLTSEEVGAVYGSINKYYSWNVQVRTPAGTYTSETKKFRMGKINEPPQIIFEQATSITPPVQIKFTVTDPEEDLTNVTLYAGPLGAGPAVATYINVPSGTTLTYELDTTKGLLSDPTLEHWWKLDGNTADEKNSTAKATILNNPTIVEGARGQAYQFNGINDTIILGRHDWIEDKNYTVALWYKVDPDATGGARLLNRGKGSACYYNPSITFNTTTQRIIVTESGCNSIQRIGGQASLGFQSATGEWRHVAVTREDDTVKVYTDGNLAYTDSYQGTPPIIANGTIIIGASYVTSHSSTPYELYMKGAIDEVVMWDRELSSEEIKNLYQGKYDSFAWSAAADDGFTRYAGKTMILEDAPIPPPQDTTPPTITMNSPDNNTVLNTLTARFNLTVIDSSLREVSLYFTSSEIPLEIQQADQGKNEYVFTKTLSADGTYKWYSKAVDSSGNSETSPVRTIIIDTTPPEPIDDTPPEITQIFPDDGATLSTNDVIFSSIATDTNLQSVTLKVSSLQDETRTGASGEYSFKKILQNGEYTWSIEARDSKGNIKTTPTRTLTINVQMPVPADTTPPEIFLESPDNNEELKNANVLFKFTATDANLKNATLYINNILNKTDTTGISGTYEFAVQMADGEYNWFAEAYDVRGNKAKSEIREFSINTTIPAPRQDTTPPTITVQTKNDSWYSTTAQLLITVQDDEQVQNSTYRYETQTFNSSWRAMTNITNTWNSILNTTALDDGIYTIRFNATDANKNTNTNSTIIIKIDKTPPIIIRQNITILNNITTYNITITDQGAGDDKSTAEITLQNGTKITLPMIKTGNSHTTTYNMTGYKNDSYNITYKVSDTLGNTALYNYTINLTAPIQEQQAQPPIAVTPPAGGGDTGGGGGGGGGSSGGGGGGGGGGGAGPAKKPPKTETPKSEQERREESISEGTGGIRREFINGNETQQNKTGETTPTTETPKDVESIIAPITKKVNAVLIALLISLLIIILIALAYYLYERRKK